MAIPDINHKVCMMCDHYTEEDCPYCGMGFEGFSVEKHNKEIYNQALEDFERKMAYFCFGLKASEGNLCRVDVVEDELQRVKRQLKI